MIDSRTALQLTEQQEIDAIPLSLDVIYLLAQNDVTEENPNTGIGALIIALAKLLRHKNRTYVDHTCGVLLAAWGFGSGRNPQ